MADEVNTHEKIRLGNDIGIRWSLIDEEDSPYIFDGRDVSVEIDIGGKKRYRVKELTHEANTLIFTYWGMDQKYTGVCSLKFIENDGNKEMVTFDIPNAFELVAHSWLTGSAPDNERVQLSFVTLTSSLTERIGPTGQSAGFGEITATIDDLVGEPSVRVITSGPNTAKNITFEFHNLKGEPGIVENLTAAMIIEALGYTPADENDIPKIKTFANVPIEGEGDIVTEITVAGQCLCAPISATFNALIMTYSGRLAALWSCTPSSGGADSLITFEDNNYDCMKSVDYHAIEFAAAGIYRILVLGSNGEVKFTTKSVNALTLPIQHYTPQKIYYKPATGIPKRDLVQEVQTSLGKADTSIQPNDLNSYYNKNEVDSKITVAAADFKGTSATGLTENQFLAWANSLTANNNDYCYWNTTDSAGNTVFKRYKYNGISWEYEYELESNQFDASQWAAIDSGITAEKVAQHDAKYSKPETGIPATDLAAGVIPTVPEEASNSEIDALFV